MKRKQIHTTETTTLIFNRDTEQKQSKTLNLKTATRTTTEICTISAYSVRNNRTRKSERGKKRVTPKCQHTSHINQQSQIRFVNLLMNFEPICRFISYKQRING